MSEIINANLSNDQRLQTSSLPWKGSRPPGGPSDHLLPSVNELLKLGNKVLGPGDYSSQSPTVPGLLD